MGRRVLLSVDDREHALIAALRERNLGDEGVEMRVEHLDVGDVQIHIDGSGSGSGEGECPIHVAWMAYERKTLDDLLASLNSGRYAEQRERLKAWRAESAEMSRSTPPSIVYLIESSDIASTTSLKVDGRTSKARIESCLVSIVAAHRLSIVSTPDVRSSADHLCQVTSMLSRRIRTGTLPLPMPPPPPPLPLFPEAEENNNNGGGDGGGGGGGNAEVRERAASRVSSKKSGNFLDARRCWVRQLCCIPGIASGIAENIAAEFPSMSDFLLAVRSTEAPAAMLCGRIPKVGTKLATRMIELMA